MSIDLLEITAKNLVVAWQRGFFVSRIELKDFSS